jgi:hypothetical protein
MTEFSFDQLLSTTVDSVLQAIMFNAFSTAISGSSYNLDGDTADLHAAPQRRATINRTQAGRPRP